MTGGALLAGTIKMSGSDRKDGVREFRVTLDEIPSERHPGMKETHVMITDPVTDTRKANVYFHPDDDDGRAKALLRSRRDTNYLIRRKLALEQRPPPECGECGGSCAVKKVYAPGVWDTVVCQSKECRDYADFVIQQKFRIVSDDLKVREWNTPRWNGYV